MKNDVLRNLIIKAGILETSYVEPEKVKEYPEDKIIKENGYHYYVNDYNMTYEEFKLALLAKQTIYLKTIKNIIVFNLVASLIAALLVLIK